jgi:hypothetical protein
MFLGFGIWTWIFFLLCFVLSVYGRILIPSRKECRSSPTFFFSCEFLCCIVPVGLVSARYNCVIFFSSCLSGFFVCFCMDGKGGVGWKACSLTSGFFFCIWRGWCGGRCGYNCQWYNCHGTVIVREGTHHNLSPTHLLLASVTCFGLPPAWSSGFFVSNSPDSAMFYP